MGVQKNNLLYAAKEKMIMSNATKNPSVLPSDVEWGFECEVPIEHKAMTVQIGFSHREQEGDETEFCVETHDSETELDNLFEAFCKENSYQDVRIDYVTVVRSAINMDVLAKTEEEM